MNKVVLLNSHGSYTVQSSDNIINGTNKNQSSCISLVAMCASQTIYPQVTSKGLTFKPGTTLKKRALLKVDGALTTSLIENLI